MIDNRTRIQTYFAIALLTVAVGGRRDVEVGVKVAEAFLERTNERPRGVLT